MAMESILSDNTTLEPIMRVAFSKSGTSQVTNSHASTENVQKNSACATTLTSQANTKITKSTAVLLVSMYLETEL